MTDQLSLNLDVADVMVELPSKSDAELEPSAASPVQPGSDHRVSSRPFIVISAAPTGGDRPTTLRACLDYVRAKGELKMSTIERMRCAVSRFEKIVRTGTTPWPADAFASLPADPREFRVILEAVKPAAQHISKSRWSDIRSAITSLMLACGWIPTEARRGILFLGAWGRVVEAALDLTERKSPIPPFARFCISQGIEPHDVVPDHLEHYERWKRTHTLGAHPRQAALSVQKAWNRLAEHFGDGGLPRLDVESRVVWKGARIQTLPTSFADELGEYLHQLGHPDRLNPRHGPPAAALTVEHARRGILRAVTYLTAAGSRLEDITSLAVLVQPAAIRVILEGLDAEYGEADAAGSWSHVATSISTILANLARRRGDLSSDQLAEALDLCGMVRGPKGGLSRRSRDKLAQFASDEERAELFELPDRAFAAAEKLFRNQKKDPNGRKGAKQHEIALALMILLTHPLRIGDLARIDIAEHFKRDRRGRLQRLVISSSKTRREIDVALPSDLVDALERHLRVFRPLILGADKGSALFPGPSGAPRAPNSIGRLLTKLVEQQLGAHFTAHLARHLAAEMILDNDPNSLPTVQRLLGHGKKSRTEDMYGVTRTSAAQKTFTKLVETLRTKSVVQRAAAQRRAR